MKHAFQEIGMVSVSSWQEQYTRAQNVWGARQTAQVENPTAECIQLFAIYVELGNTKKIFWKFKEFVTLLYNSLESSKQFEFSTQIFGSKYWSIGGEESLIHGKTVWSSNISLGFVHMVCEKPENLMRQLAWAAHSLMKFLGFSKAFLRPYGQSLV